VVEARRFRLAAIVLAAVARERDQHGVAERRVAPYATRDFVSVDAGQPDVDDHEVGRIGARRRERRGALAEHADAMPQELEEERQALRRVRMVLDEQDAGTLAGFGDSFAHRLVTRMGSRRARWVLDGFVPATLRTVSWVYATWR
jgi:hypothetical protein